MVLVRYCARPHQELQVQDRMVDDLGNRIDTAQEHVANVNTRMKVSRGDLTKLTSTVGASIWLCLMCLIFIMLEAGIGDLNLLSPVWILMVNQPLLIECVPVLVRLLRYGRRVLGLRGVDIGCRTPCQGA